MSATETEAATNSVAADFDLDFLNIENKTAVFEMPLVTPEAALIVKPATPENKRYNAASLHLSAKRQRRIVQTGSMTKAEADDDRNEDRVLYPKYVIVGWRGIFNKAGELVPFSPEACAKFIKVLPLYLFDRLRMFCLKPERFVTAGEDVADLVEPNPVELAGN